MASGWPSIPRATPSSVAPHKPIYGKPVLVLANDTELTDHILVSTDEGLTWRDKFMEKMRVRSIVTVALEVNSERSYLSNPNHMTRR